MIATNLGVIVQITTVVRPPLSSPSFAPITNREGGTSSTFYMPRKNQLLMPRTLRGTVNTDLIPYDSHKLHKIANREGTSRPLQKYTSCKSNWTGHCSGTRHHLIGSFGFHPHFGMTTGGRYAGKVTPFVPTVILTSGWAGSSNSTPNAAVAAYILKVIHFEEVSEGCDVDPHKSEKEFSARRFSSRKRAKHFSFVFRSGEIILTHVIPFGASWISAIFTIDSISISLNPMKKQAILPGAINLQ